MSTIRLDPATLTVQLTPWEHVFALRGNVTVPRADIVSGAVVTDALAAARGVRAPGLGAPGVRKVGPGGPAGRAPWCRCAGASRLCTSGCDRPLTGTPSWSAATTPQRS